MHQAFAIADRSLSPRPGPGGPLHVLLVGDERSALRSLAAWLASLGCDVVEVSSGAAAVGAVRRQAFHFVLCELELGRESAVDLLPRLLGARPGIHVVILGTDLRYEVVVEAMRRGAKDCVPKPLSLTDIGRLVDEARQRGAEREVELQADAADSPRADAGMREPASPRMRSVWARVQRAAALDGPVLFHGEQGTGKRSLARALHAWSARCGGPFVEACPRDGPDRDVIGAIAAADSGTAYIDEISRLPLEAQEQVVRVLHEGTIARAGERRSREIDVRIVAGTSRDLEEEVRAGRVREDLLYPLQVTRIEVPPLRQRPEDILPLAEAFAASLTRQTRTAAPTFPLTTRRLLVTWAWPGNLCELREVVERAIIRTPDAVEPESLPARLALQPPGPPMPGGPHTAEEIEREHAVRVLAWAGSVSEAARILGITKSTLLRKRRRWSRPDAAT